MRTKTEVKMQVFTVKSPASHNCISGRYYETFKQSKHTGEAGVTICTVYMTSVTNLDFVTKCDLSESWSKHV